MDKLTLLQTIKVSVQQNLVTQAEINAVLAELDQVAQQKKLSIVAIFYYIGAAIVVLGIGALCWEYWQLLSFKAKLGITFGTGVSAYFLGVLLQEKWQLPGPANGFYLLANLTLFLGLWILINKTSFYIHHESGAKSVIFIALFLLQWVSYKIFKQPLFILFAIIFGSCWFFYATDFALGHYFFNSEQFFEYRILLIGLAYLLLGYYFAVQRPLLSGALYGFGACFFLTAALFLNNWSQQSNFWEWIFPGLTFGLMFLSVYLKRKVLLVFGSAYLMVYILKITDKYFANSLGWSLALVVAGLMLMLVGVVSLYYAKKYLSK